MAYTDLDKPSLYFNAKAYTGDGTTSNTITGIGFQSDMVWFKSRSTTDSHFLTDSVRGITKYIRPSATNAEETETTAITSLTSDGYVLSTAGNVNDNNVTYASWNWKANGSGSANTDGSLSSTVSANTTAGFSIVKWTGNRSQTQTIGHGLGSIPKMIIIKNLSATQGWTVYSSEIGANERLVLNNTNAKGTCTACFGNTRPTSSVFTVGDDADTNGTGNAMIAYCFADVKGYSKMASYIGNGSSTDGTFVYTGFKPAFVLWKKSSDTGNWLMMDDKRSTFNFAQTYLKANATAAEDVTSSDIRWDFLSNGLKCRGDSSSINSSGAKYIYKAFASNPFVATSGSDAIPVTAR